MFDIFETFKLLNDIDTPQRNDTIDEDGIKIEMPGVKSSDVKVTVEGRYLKVVGKSRHGREFNYHYSLKSNTDSDAIVAKLQDGLLDIKLPKKQSETSVKRIDIQS